MVKYLLDSNIIAAASSGRLPVVVKLSSLKPGDVAVSVIGRMEAELALLTGDRAKARSAKLLRELLAHLQVMDFGLAEAQRAATLGAYLEQTGERLAGYDLLVAATALTHQLTLVTDRAAAFAHVPGLDVENWLWPGTV